MTRQVLFRVDCVRHWNDLADDCSLHCGDQHMTSIHEAYCILANLYIYFLFNRKTVRVSFSSF